MKLYRSLVFRELRITRKREFLLFLLFVLLAGLFALPALVPHQNDIFFIDTTETEKYVIVVLLTIIPAAIGSFMAGCNNGIHKTDINAGWKRFSLALPAKPAQKAAADLIVKLIYFLLFGTAALSLVLIYGIRGFSMAVEQTVNVFLTVGALSLLFDTVYCGVIMIANEKRELKKLGAIAGIAGIVLLEIVDHFISLNSLGKDEAENVRILKDFADTLGSVKFTVFAVAVFSVMCIVYFSVLRIMYKRREP